MTEVRRLGPADWRRYRTLRLAALADAPGAFRARLADEEALPEAAWRERLVRRAHFAAQLSGEDADAGTIGVDTPGAAAELVALWVAPPARGRGVGDRLVAAALDWAAAQGHATVRLWVVDGNGFAERLYARHGFVRTGDRDGKEIAMVRPAPGPT